MLRAECDVCRVSVDDASAFVEQGAEDALGRGVQPRRIAVWAGDEHRTFEPTDDGLGGPGDITSLPSGHDAWVVGDEPVVVVDWYGASRCAKPA